VGLNVGTVRGLRIVSHGGAVFGFQANVVLIPEKNIGFAILINSEDGETILGLTNQLLDHYLEKPTQDWPATWRAFKKQRQERAMQQLSTATASPAGVGPSLPLARYAGTFADPWYGPISITHADGRLTLDFKQTPGMLGKLTHWQYDTFRVDWRDPLIEPAYVTFALTPKGTIDRVTMRAVSPLADFSFDYQDLELRPVAEH
jgi:hypothetical protein